jgi:hypothetical protein
VGCDPLNARLPLQPFEPTQDVALLEAQVNVALLPEVIALGAALKLTDGAGWVCCETVTVAACAALPPGPRQVNR